MQLYVRHFSFIRGVAVLLCTALMEHLKQDIMLMEHLKQDIMPMEHVKLSMSHLDQDALPHFVIVIYTDLIVLIQDFLLQAFALQVFMLRIILTV